MSKWLKKLEQQFYGSCMAYDRALRREGGVSAQQAAFVDALLKNVYDDDAGRRPWASLLARYLTRCGRHVLICGAVLVLHVGCTLVCATAASAGVHVLLARRRRPSLLLRCAAALCRPATPLSLAGCRLLCRELQCLQATELDAVYRGQIRFSRDVVVKAPGGAR